MSNWGGKREGAGRPKGTLKTESHRRAPRSVATFEDEWALIYRFAKEVKYGDRELCEKFIEKIDSGK